MKIKHIIATALLTLTISTAVLADDCNQIKNNDLRHLCRGETIMINDSDLRQFSAGNCDLIKDSDWRNVCYRKTDQVRDSDLRNLAAGDCFLIKDDDLRKLCRGMR
ncbi:hypothetical protein [Maridesulfovibrio ferrireducens]|uniref:hypothetical protein n=1 Tax=Maridesulfovibrio ferrireducens TaxID=246191 RepID=UPI001A209EEA|nr:hypothetical protein [Maridesulfovibrio ferrireducens]MBI9110027.1 hypothetical protein [Maridesulfovibrio ferrireducens]